MTQIFLWILALSLSGALAGLLLLMVRPATMKFFSKKWNYYSWLLVAVYLILPVRLSFIEIPVPKVISDLTKLQNISELYEALAPLPDAERQEEEMTQEAESMQMTQSQEVPAQPQADTEQSQAAPAQSQAAPAQPQADTAQSQAAPAQPQADTARLWTEGASVYEASKPGRVAGRREIQQAGAAAAAVWILGVLAFFGIKIGNYGRFSMQLRAGSRLVDEKQITALAQRLCTDLSLKTLPAIYESDDVPGPVTLGLRHPVIILPKEDRKLGELSLALHHELVHIKRKDLYYKWLYQMLLCVHWFNPVLYLVARKINIDCELSCDEAVLGTLTEDGKRAYGNVLLNTAEKNVDFRRNVLSTTLLERKEDLKKRLKEIIRYKKQSGVKILFSGCAFLMVFFLSACGAQIASDAMSAGRAGASFSEDASGENLNFFERLFWNVDLDAWLDSMNFTDESGEGWEVYEDNAMLAGEDVCGQWRAYFYSGGEKLDCAGFLITGSDSILIVNAAEETEIQLSCAFELIGGKFKIVHISPDGAVTVIDENGDGNKNSILLEKGRNVIKMAGQGAKLKNLKIRYYGINSRWITHVYYSEEEEYADLVQTQAEEGGVDKEKLMATLPYMEGRTVSEVMIALLRQGVVFSKDELVYLFIYSDEEYSSKLLTEALAKKEVAPLDEEALTDLMPYLPSGARGALICAMEVSPGISALVEWAPYLSEEEIEEILLRYLELGNKLTYSQLIELQYYISDKTVEKLDRMLEED